MSGYQVAVREIGNNRLEISNGLATAQTAFGPEPNRFLATELFLASLGSCMLATMMYQAAANGTNLSGASVRVLADSEKNPDRMTNIRVIYRLPSGLGEAKTASLVRAGNRCKVHATIEHHPDFKISVEEFEQK